MNDPTPSALALRLGHAVFELMMRAAMEQQVNVLMLPSSQDFAALLDRAGLQEEAGRAEELQHTIELWEACGASHKELKELFAPLLHRAEAAEAKLARLREAAWKLVNHQWLPVQHAYLESLSNALTKVVDSLRSALIELDDEENP